MKFTLPHTILALGAISPSLVQGHPQQLLPKDIALENRDVPLLGAEQICGTKQPTPALREVHQALLEDPGVLPRLIGRSDPRPFEKRDLEERQSNRPLVIQVFIHWVTTFDQAQHYTQTVRANVIQDQVS